MTRVWRGGVREGGVIWGEAIDSERERIFRAGCDGRRGGVGVWFYRTKWGWVAPISRAYNRRDASLRKNAGRRGKVTQAYRNEAPL
jgi:hypothetical protein